ASPTGAGAASVAPADIALGGAAAPLAVAVALTAALAVAGPTRGDLRTARRRGIERTGERRAQRAEGGRRGGRGGPLPHLGTGRPPRARRGTQRVGGTRIAEGHRGGGLRQRRRHVGRARCLGGGEVLEPLGERGPFLVGHPRQGARGR